MSPHALTELTYMYVADFCLLASFVASPDPIHPKPFACFNGLPNSAQQRQRDLSVTALWRHLEKSHAKNLLQHLKAGYRF